ncbi:hypothetical protein DBR43_00840 [Pedobacter sp. KBW06]|uniref:hypothetical protein n=1 Tax=Pedobacter sp. KBW06 TaxID=2153359 RepID=UPI000F5A3EAE|nr:hypothetical protein [Pedobacter sp. KBW06]RQO73986.1 hypothetical protein DBR43_00840 [Pedobacter sp. KBW06]
MEDSIKGLLDLLQELYVRTHNEQSWVIDATPGHGFTAAIETISAEQASTRIVKGGSTIASHTEHLRWSLCFALEFYKGNTPPDDWGTSWKISEVNESQWIELQQDLLEAYLLVREAIAEVKDWSNPDLWKGTLALLPHAAYHLGAVKQIMLVVKENT